jgi:hypothetical protein
MNIFTQFFKKKNISDNTKIRIRRDLIRQEAVVGRHVFGSIPEGHSREFFRVDKGTWVWQESWIDGNRLKHERHTKYVVRDKDIVKSVNNGSYERVTIEEAENFEAAVHEYVARVDKEVYKNGNFARA